MCAQQELPIAHSFFLCCPACRGWKIHKKHPCQDIYSYKNFPSDRCHPGQDKETTFKSCERDIVGDTYWWFHQGGGSIRDDKPEWAGDSTVKAEAEVSIKQDPDAVDELVTDCADPHGLEVPNEDRPIPNADACSEEVRTPGQKHEPAYLSFLCGHLGQMAMPKPAFTAKPKFDQWPLPLQYPGQGDDNKHLGVRGLACGCYTSKVPDILLGDDAVGYGSEDDKPVWNITSKCFMCNERDVANKERRWTYALNQEVKVSQGPVRPLTPLEEDPNTHEVQQARRLRFLEENQFFEHREQYARTLRGADVEENGPLVYELSRYKPKEHDAISYQDKGFGAAANEPGDAVWKFEDGFQHFDKRS